jgi:hypothetical protein
MTPGAARVLTAAIWGFHRQRSGRHGERRERRGIGVRGSGSRLRRRRWMAAIVSPFRRHRPSAPSADANVSASGLGGLGSEAARSARRTNRPDRAMLRTRSGRIPPSRSTRPGSSPVAGTVL